MPGPMRDPSPGAGDRIRRGMLQHRAGDPRDTSQVDEPVGDLDPATAGRTDRGPGDLEGWTVERLRRRAAELGVAGRSSMSKAELVAALRAR